MEIRHFRHFIAVADELHFGRAARRLNIEQAPLSQSIKRLEKSLDTILFDRSNRQTRLTASGTIFLEEARRSVSQFDKAITVARQSRDCQSTPLAIGFVTAGILRLLPMTIRKFRSTNSARAMHLVEASTTDLLAGVSENKLDLALVHPTSPCPSSITLEEIQRDRIIAALPKTHHLCRRPVLLMDDLANEPLIFFPKSANPELYEKFQSFFFDRGLKPQIEQEVRLTPTILSLVSAGLGYALIQESARHLPFPDITFRPISDFPPDLVWAISVAWKPATALPMTQVFVDMLRGVAMQA